MAGLTNCQFQSLDFPIQCFTQSCHRKKSFSDKCEGKEYNMKRNAYTIAKLSLLLHCLKTKLELIVMVCQPHHISLWINTATKMVFKKNKQNLDACYNIGRRLRHLQKRELSRQCSSLGLKSLHFVFQFHNVPHLPLL